MAQLLHGKKWIKRTDRLPEADDFDSENEIWATYANGSVVRESYSSFFVSLNSISHTARLVGWMPTDLQRPNPPTWGID